MQDRMQAAKSFEQEQKDKEAERQYLEKYRPKTLQVQDQAIERGTLGIADDKLKLEGSQKLKAARDALDAQVAGEWSFVAPEDAGNVMGWKAELATLNREGNKAIAPQDYYRLKKESMSEEKRKQGKYESELETEKVNRERGNFVVPPGVMTPEGNAVVLDTRKGRIVDSGFDKLKPSAPSGNKRDVVIEGGIQIPGLEPIPGVEITKDSVKKTKDAYALMESFKKKLADYKDNIKKYGSEAVGEKADEMTAQHVGLGMALKELDHLGVLTGGDWKLTLDQIPKASGLAASAKGKSYGLFGANPFIPKIDVVGKKIDTDFNAFSKANGFQIAKPPQTEDDPDSAFNSVYGQSPSGAKGGSSFDFSRFKK